jgi:HSP20 family protein
MNVSETENEIHVAAELPGVREEDIDVSLNDDILTIRGEKRFERQDEKENFHVVERSFGTFQRSIRLPFPVDPEQVQARFDNGVLMVTMPKTAQQQRTKRIQVQRGAGGTPGGQMIQGEATNVEDQQRQVGREPSQQQQGERGSKGDQAGGTKAGRQQG